jgi:hypothetical protein
LPGYDALSKVNEGMDDTKNRGRCVFVSNSLRIFPIRDEPEIYGAVVMGEYDFFSTESGKLKTRVLRSSFTQLMRLKDGVWKVACIYSYNHQPVVDTKK